MYEHHDWALDVLEQAERETPFCHCGAPTALVADDDFGVWLQCADHEPSASTLKRVLTLDTHVRQRVLG
jgi:hypothetical protein